MNEGFKVWSECEFLNGQRGDLVAIQGNQGYIVEIETKKSKGELEKKLASKQTYPKEFTLRWVVVDEDFNINEFKL